MRPDYLCLFQFNFEFKFHVAMDRKNCHTKIDIYNEILHFDCEKCMKTMHTLSAQCKQQKLPILNNIQEKRNWTRWNEYKFKKKRKLWAPHLSLNNSIDLEVGFFYLQAINFNVCVCTLEFTKLFDRKWP